MTRNVVGTIKADTRAHIGRIVRLVALAGAALALGACSKCDFPDFTHWGSQPPHACQDGALQH